MKTSGIFMEFFKDLTNLGPVISLRLTEDPEGHKTEGSFSKAKLKFFWIPKRRKKKHFLIISDKSFFFLLKFTVSLEFFYKKCLKKLKSDNS